AHISDLSGRVKANLETHREQALLSKRLVTIICDAPCPVDLESLKLQPRDEQKLKSLLIEFEFNSIGRRLFGDDFRTGRGFDASAAQPAPATKSSAPADLGRIEELVLTGETEAMVAEEKPVVTANSKTIAEVPHEYHLVSSAAERAALVQALQNTNCLCFRTEAAGRDPKPGRLVGLGFSFASHSGYYVPLPRDAGEAARVLKELRPVFESHRIEKVGHDLKADLSVLRWHGVTVQGKLFDTMVAHSLIEPE